MRMCSGVTWSTGPSPNSEICCGQVAGLINEVKSASKVVDDVVGNISKRVEELKERLDYIL